MNDTSFEMENVYREMMMKKSGQDRLRMGFSMFAMVRKQVMASIYIKSPNLSKSEFKKELFLRFYGNDFSTVEKESILKKIF